MPSFDQYHEAALRAEEFRKERYSSLLEPDPDMIFTFDNAEQLDEVVEDIVRRRAYRKASQDHRKDAAEGVNGRYQALLGTIKINEHIEDGGEYHLGGLVISKETGE